MTKQAARREYLTRRMTLETGEYQALSDQILSRFKDLTFPTLHCVHLYHPMASRKEIDTLPFVRHLETLFPGLLLVVPRVSGPDTLEHIEWHADTNFTSNAWGIPEPLEGRLVSPLIIDLVLVPLIIFDDIGTRVGYGKGFYDRFLSTCRPEVLKIGLSLFDPIPSLEDRADFDVPLSIGITPTQSYEFV